MKITGETSIECWLQSASTAPGEPAAGRFCQKAPCQWDCAQWDREGGCAQLKTNLQGNGCLCWYRKFLLLNWICTNPFLIITKTSLPGLTLCSNPLLLTTLSLSSVPHRVVSVYSSMGSMVFQREDYKAVLEILIMWLL